MLPTRLRGPARSGRPGRGAGRAGPVLPGHQHGRAQRGASAPGHGGRCGRGDRTGRAGHRRRRALHPQRATPHPRHRPPHRPVGTGDHHPHRPPRPAPVGRTDLPLRHPGPTPRPHGPRRRLPLARMPLPPRRRPPHHRLGPRRAHRPDQHAAVLPRPPPQGPPGPLPGRPRPRHRSRRDPPTRRHPRDAPEIHPQDAPPPSTSPTTPCPQEKPAPASTSTTSSRTWPTETAEMTVTIGRREDRRRRSARGRLPSGDRRARGSSSGSTTRRWARPSRGTSTTTPSSGAPTGPGTCSGSPMPNRWRRSTSGTWPTPALPTCTGRGPSSRSRYREPGLGESALWAPHVIGHDGRWWMFVCGGGPAPTEFRIHLAVSEDLVTWERHREPSAGRRVRGP